MQIISNFELDGEQWRIQDFPWGGGGALTRWGGADPGRVHFLAKMYAKMKEMDPVGGGGGHAPAVPPGSTNGEASIFGNKCVVS